MQSNRFSDEINTESNLCAVEKHWCRTSLDIQQRLCLGCSFLNDGCQLLSVCHGWQWRRHLLWCWPAGLYTNGHLTGRILSQQGKYKQTSVHMRHNLCVDMRTFPLWEMTIKKASGTQASYVEHFSSKLSSCSRTRKLCKDFWFAPVHLMYWLFDYGATSEMSYRAKGFVDDHWFPMFLEEFF